ncbi:MAG: CHAD domain-containing protein [Vicinamibacterales bacterium]
MSHRTTAIVPALTTTMAVESGRLTEAIKAAQGGDLGALRRARVASRRLRELLAIVEAADPDVPAHRARRQLRAVTRALGPMRELDVARAELDAAARRRRWPDERLAPLRRALGKEHWRRSEALSEWMDEFDSKRLARVLVKTSRGLDDATGDAVWQRAIAARVLDRVRAVHSAASACGTLYAPDRLHEMRIATKKLRYVLELGRKAARLDVAVAIRALKRTQRRYGQLHDIQVLLRLVAQAAVSGRGTALRVAAAIVTDALERDCRELHAAALRDSAALADLLQGVRRTLADAAMTSRRPAGATSVRRQGGAAPVRRPASLAS